MNKAFKIVSLFVMVVAMAFLSSCTKSKEDQIIGKWKCVSFIVYDGDETHDLTEFNQYIIELRLDGSYYVGDQQMGTYTLEDSKLTMKDEEGDCVVYTITELTDKKLVIRSIGSMDEEGYEPNEEGYYEICVFEKI